MSSIAPSMARSWLGTVGASALILCFGIGTGIMAARLLGPADRGLLALLIFWPTLMSGIGYLSLQEAGVYRRSRTVISSERFVSTIVFVSLLMSFPVILIGMIALASLIGADRIAELPTAQTYLLFFVPSNFLMLALMTIDHADRRFTRYNVLRLLPSGIYLLGLSLLWAAGKISVETALWASLAGTILTALARSWVLRSQLRALPSWREGLALLNQGVFFHGATLLRLLATQVDRLFLFALFANATIGQYVVALSIAQAGLARIMHQGWRA